MFIKIEIQQHEYFRLSKLGHKHAYVRNKTAVILRCDSCDTEFVRDLKHMNKKRLNNNYFHCCSACDTKKFAQRIGVEQKKIWDMPASTTLPVGKY
jgi:predicted transcriptional regulator YdeE